MGGKTKWRKYGFYCAVGVCAIRAAFRIVVKFGLRKQEFLTGRGFGYCQITSLFFPSPCSFIVSFFFFFYIFLSFGNTRVEQTIFWRHLTPDICEMKEMLYQAYRQRTEKWAGNTTWQRKTISIHISGFISVQIGVKIWHCPQFFFFQLLGFVEFLFSYPLQQRYNQAPKNTFADWQTFVAIDITKFPNVQHSSTTAQHSSVHAFFPTLLPFIHLVFPNPLNFLPSFRLIRTLSLIPFPPSQNPPSPPNFLVSSLLQWLQSPSFR